MAKTSPTQRTLAECRARGYVVQVVEHWNQYAHIRQDLFGVIDLVALTPSGILGIQACAGASHAIRRDKILAEPRAKAWLKAGGRLAIWSWSKRGPRGKRKVWALREEALLLRSDVIEAAQTGAIPADEARAMLARSV